MGMAINKQTRELHHLIYEPLAQLAVCYASRWDEVIQSQIFHPQKIICPSCDEQDTNYMCRYQAWDDELHEEEIYQRSVGDLRHEPIAVLEQLENCMNEMRRLIESMKEISARLTRINCFLYIFLFSICLVEVLKYLIRKS